MFAFNENCIPGRSVYFFDLRLDNHNQLIFCCSVRYREVFDVFPFYQFFLYSLD